MTPGGSLAKKILGLGLLNVVLAVVILIAFARLRYQFDLAAFLEGVTRDRILAIASAFRTELETGANKDNLIRTYAQRYDADVFLTTPEGEGFHGASVDFPMDVVHRVREGGPRHPPDGPEEKRGKREAKREAKGEEPDLSRLGPPPRELFFLVRTHNPRYYWAVVRMPAADEFGVFHPALLVFRSHSAFNAKLFFDWGAWLGLVAAVTVVSLFIWIPFLRSLTRSIAQMDRVTTEIAQGRFEARVPDQRRDEVGDLGQQINVMAGRLENFVKSQKRFLGDIAHELTAPIARIQFALGILEQRAGEAAQGNVETLRAEIQEMSELVNELLSFSKAGLGAGAIALEPVSVHSVLQRAAAREAVDIETDIDERLVVLAHQSYLQRAVGNLIRNAWRYAGQYGAIRVTAYRDRDKTVITVADNGPGLPPDSLEHVFEPFYRSEASRSRDTGGVGLGLAIVKSCVDACQGTVSCRNRDGGGFEVSIRLNPAGSARLRPETSAEGFQQGEILQPPLKPESR